MKKILVSSFIVSVFLTCNSLFSEIYAQSSVSRDTVLLAGREIISETAYCGLVTIDSSGFPQIRTMNPFPVKDDFVIWFATSRISRKVIEIKNNPNVLVYFANHQAPKGYVSIKGLAEVIDDKDLLVKMKRDYWNGIKGWQDIFVLIKIIPKSLEVINYKHGLNNDPSTFRAPVIKF